MAVSIAAVKNFVTKAKTAAKTKSLAEENISAKLLSLKIKILIGTIAFLILVPMITILLLLVSSDTSLNLLQGVDPSVKGYSNGAGVNLNYDFEEYYNASESATLSSGPPSQYLSSTEYGNLEGFNKHIKDSVEAAGYGTRAGVVAAGMSMVGDYILKTGYKLRYSQPARQGPEHDGIVNEDFYQDCSSFAWWALYNGGFKTPCDAVTDSISAWTVSAGNNKPASEGKPGDFLVTKGRGHIILIVGTYDGGYYCAEFRGDAIGAEITKHDFGSLGNYWVIDMESYYNDPSNLR